MRLLACLHKRCLLRYVFDCEQVLISYCLSIDLPIGREIFAAYKHQVRAFLLSFGDPHQLGDPPASGRIVGRDQQILLRNPCVHTQNVGAVHTNVFAAFDE